jgi:hypothetical protein
VAGRKTAGWGRCAKMPCLRALPSVRRSRLQAGVAQLVEQLIRNQQVAGSSPIAGSTFRQCLRAFLGMKAGPTIRPFSLGSHRAHIRIGSPGRPSDPGREGRAEPRPRQGTKFGRRQNCAARRLDTCIGLSHAAAARELGVSEPTIKRWRRAPRQRGSESLSHVA